MCTSEAIHYCNELEKCFTHYPNNGTNRFFEIEVLGDFIDDSTKSGARCIRFIKEVPAEEIKKVKEEKESEKLDLQMNLQEVKNLQIAYPHLIIGGSISLYFTRGEIRKV